MIYNINNTYLRRIALIALMPFWALFIIIIFFIAVIDSLKNKNLIENVTHGDYFLYEVRKDIKDIKLCWSGN